MALVPTLFCRPPMSPKWCSWIWYRYHTVAWCIDGFAVPALMALSIAFPLAYVAFAACTLLRRQMEKEHALGCGDARRENESASRSWEARTRR